MMSELLGPSYKVSLAAISSLIAANLSCTTESPKPTFQNRPASLSPTRIIPISTPEQKLSFDPDVIKFYPELAGNLPRPIITTTTFQSQTRWLNFSNAILEQSAVVNLTTYLENLARSSYFIEVNYQGINVPVSLAPRPRHQRIFFLVPENSPTPGWSNISQGGASTGTLSQDSYVSFTRMYDQAGQIPTSQIINTPELAGNKVVAVELCQSSLLISSATTAIAGVMQEIFCNSLGSTIAAKGGGLIYPEYARWAKTVSYRANPNSQAYPMIILSEADYNSIPLKSGTIRLP